jgi:hypothetical protein
MKNLDDMSSWTSVLDQAATDLQALSRGTEKEIGSLGRGFEGLAEQAGKALALTERIVGCVDSTNVTSAAGAAQLLRTATTEFISSRLAATVQLLERLTAAINLLRLVSSISAKQEEIALQTKALSVLTNIEVAHLGGVAGSFQYLAEELSSFSSSLRTGTQELGRQTGSRRSAMEETRQSLSAEFPRLRKELERLEGDLGRASEILDSSLGYFLRAPRQFQTCVEDITRQIAGVVAAVQANDITRQQIEHVQTSLATISCMAKQNWSDGDAAARELPSVHAGLVIQAYQLRSIRRTVTTWSSQIAACIGEILRVSASDTQSIGLKVLENERGASCQLERVVTLRQVSEAQSGKVLGVLNGLSSLSELASEHIKRANAIRHHLHLLALNTIIESTRLNNRGDTIHAIANCIKEVAAEWSGVTNRSAATLSEMSKLIAQTNEEMGTLSNGSNEKLRQAESEVKTALDDLRGVASQVAEGAHEVQLVTQSMQERVVDIGRQLESLEVFFRGLDSVTAEVEAVISKLDLEEPDLKARYDVQEVERLFAAYYTTETEREVMRAAMLGSGLPEDQHALNGNSVELF